MGTLLNVAQEDTDSFFIQVERPPGMRG